MQKSIDLRDKVLEPWPILIGRSMAPSLAVRIALVDSPLRDKVKFTLQEAAEESSSLVGGVPCPVVICSEVPANNTMPCVFLPGSPEDAHSAIGSLGITSGALLVEEIEAHLLRVTSCVADGYMVATAGVADFARSHVPLSGRQLEILSLLIHGARNAEIAREVMVSLATVKRDLQDLFRLFDVANRTALVMSLHQRNLVAALPDISRAH